MMPRPTDTRTALLATVLAERFDTEAIAAEQWITPGAVAAEEIRQRIVAQHPEPLDVCMERRRALGRATWGTNRPGSPDTAVA